VCLGPRTVVVVCVLAVLACTPNGEHVDEAPPPAAARLEPVAFDGDCSRGPAMGSLDAYASASATLITNETGVRVRVCAVWPATDLRNVLGVIPAGKRVPVFGPVKHPLWSAGVGYVVPLVDDQGRRCRGYVSDTVLERVDLHAVLPSAGALPLPDARPAWVGPCLPEQP
jgi:hypothetical protein